MAVKVRVVPSQSLIGLWYIEVKRNWFSGWHELTKCYPYDQATSLALKLKIQLNTPPKEG